MLEQSLKKTRICVITRLLQLAEYTKQTEWNNMLIKCGFPHFFALFILCYTTDMLQYKGGDVP